MADLVGVIGDSNQHLALDCSVPKFINSRVKTREYLDFLLAGRKDGPLMSGYQ